ncbi:MAG TPA: hypothetical protein VMC08_08445 [Bacteroidales bacterium]|nr:hypothetical protein [Bacteroidales bacterium]
MTPEPEENKTRQEFSGGIRRPLGVTLLCLFSLVFFGLISLLFLFSVFYSGTITEVLNYYLTGTLVRESVVLVYTIGMFVLHSACFAGTLLMWKMKKRGFFLFAVSALLITLFQLFRSHVPVGTTAVYIALIIFFGVFYRKMGSSQSRI